MLFSWWWAIMAETPPYGSIPVAVLFDKSLGREVRLLYVAIWWWDFAGKHPTQDEMASDLGCSPANVWRGIRDLEQAGLVEQKRGGYGKPNVVKPLAGPVVRGKQQSPPREEPESSHRGDRVLPERTRVVTTQEGEGNGESARAGERAGGRDEQRRQRILKLFSEKHELLENRLSADLDAKDTEELERMVAEGLVRAEAQALGRRFTLTKEA